MNLLGVPRLTMDVDLPLALDEANLDAFIQCTRVLRMRPQIPEPSKALKGPERRRAWREDTPLIAFALLGGTRQAPGVDVLLEHPLDFAAAYARAELRDAEGVTVRVASIPDMIVLKRRAGRPQDIADVEHLERLQGKQA